MHSPENQSLRQEFWCKYLGGDHRKQVWEWSSETGKGRKPIKGVLISRLLLWATEAQSCWGPPEWMHRTHLRIVRKCGYLSSRNVAIYSPTPVPTWLRIAIGALNPRHCGHLLHIGTAQFHSQKTFSGREMQAGGSCFASIRTLHWGHRGLGGRGTRRGEWGIYSICYMSFFTGAQTSPGPKPSSEYLGFKSLLPLF